tara:strand:- start:3739 stop:5493 length:1755 start_codon:yes stop_codon:yes gene_type:complete
MSKQRDKGIMIQTLDTATSKMQGRDKAYESMVNQTLNIIPEAIAMKDRIENERKKRLAKAKRLQITFKLPSLDAAKQFLNEYDPDGTQTTLQLQKQFEQLRFTTNQNIIDQTNTTGGMPTGFIAGSQSMSLPTDVSKGIDKYIGMPTIEDAIVGAEEKLGLSAGTGRDALNYVNPANIGPDPYRFQTSGAYSFVPESERVGQGTEFDENTIKSDFRASIGGRLLADNTYDFPQIIYGKGQNQQSMDKNTAYAPYLASFDENATDIIRFRRNKKGTTIENVSTQNEIEITTFTSNLIATITEGNSKYNDPLFGKSLVDKETGEIDITNLDYLTKEDPTGFLKGAFETAQISIPYEAIYTVLQKNDSSVTQVDTDSVLRPSYSLAQLRLLDKDPNYNLNDLKTTYKGTEMSVVSAQQKWDAEEMKKIQRLTTHIGEASTARLVAAVHGTGSYTVPSSDATSIHDNINDGFAGSTFSAQSIGSYDNAEARFKQVLKRNGMPDAVIESMSVASVKKLLDNQAIDEKQLDEGYKRGYIPQAIVTSEKGGTPYMYKGKTEMRGAVPATYDYRWYDTRTGKVYDKDYNEIK